MDNILFQVIIFSNNQNISVNTENSIKLLNAYAEFGFIPTTIQEITNSNPAPILRPRLQLPDSTWSITILSDRVSIENNFLGSPIEIEEFIPKATKFAQIFMKEFDMLGNRISLISKTMFPEMKPEKLIDVYNKFSIPHGVYHDQPPLEWNVRSAPKVTFDVLGNAEPGHFITNIGRGHGEITIKGDSKKFDRIFVDYDINTDGDNMAYRFTTEAVSDFFNKVSVIRKEDIKRLDGIING